MKNIKFASFISIALMAAPLLPLSNAHAAGFFLYEQGARATGRAGAVMATIDDGSAIFHNVAGIAGTKGYSALIGASYVAPNAAYVNTAGESLSTNQGAAVTPNIYLTAKLTDMIAVGVGFNTPFGSTISWPSGSVAASVVKEQSLRTFFITPAVALNLEDMGLRLGAGLDLVPADVRLQREIPFGTERASADLGGAAFGVGGRIGVQYNPPALKGLHVGVAFRSPVSLNFKGNGDFDASPQFRGSLPADGPVSVPVTLPMSLNAGVAYEIADFQVEAGVTWTDWTSYKEINVDVAGDLNDNIVSRKDYRAKAALRIGAEYALRNIGLDVRAGVAIDPTPIPAQTLDVSLPDIDRTNLTGGFTYHVSDKLWADVGLLYILPGKNSPAAEPGNPPLKGTYELSVFVAALSLGMSFGGEESADMMMPSDVHTAEPPPAEAAPVEPVPAEAIPPEAVPTEVAPAEPASADAAPAEVDVAPAADDAAPAPEAAG